jgi:integrase
MRGHIAKKGTRYYAVVYEGIDSATGRGRHRWHSAGPTRRDAERLLAELVKRSHDGDYRAPERITLGTYLVERWLPTKQAQLRPSTYDSYRRNIEGHVIPALGARPLQRLVPEDLDGLYASLLANGRRNGSGGGLSPKTVRYIHGILRKALADAQRKGSVARNVADLADPPKASARARREMRVWSAAELLRFLELVEDHHLFVAFFLAANTGMRRGEVLGLRWKDVELDRARLSVNQAVVSVAYEVKVGDVKTDTARRTIDLDGRTVALLRRSRKQQLEDRLAAGRSWDEASFVTARLDGSPIHPDYFSQCFHHAVARSDLPRIRLHDLRHTHASILLRAGQPVKVVSERLGHANPAFTMSVYQHVLPGMQADAAAAFSAALFVSTT